MSWTKAQYQAAKLKANARLLKELTPKERDVVTHCDSRPRSDKLYIVTPDIAPDGTTWAWHVSDAYYSERHDAMRCCGGWTVEDHGTHWRVRPEGRRERWHTVVKA